MAEQIVFDHNGSYYIAENCENAEVFENVQLKDGRWVTPKFEGQVINYDGGYLGIQVERCSEAEYNAITDSSGGEDGYLTDCGRFFKNLTI